MTTSLAERMRSFGWFLIAAVYFLLAQLVASHAAQGLASPDWYQPVSRGMLLFLLLIGYAAMGHIGQRQGSPLRAMGLALRHGWGGEFALGAVLGWGGLLACVLPVALFGALAIQVRSTSHQWLMLLADTAALACAALAEEIAFRGYPFQRLIEAIGPGIATLFLSLLFTAAHFQNPSTTSASLFTTLLAGLLLALAYLRTRALWVGWGFHFAWNASMGLLFGLPISGLTIFSPVVSTYTRGPVWLTGGGYGPEGSAVAIVVLCALLFVLARTTRELKYRYATTVITAGGIPVDIDALARQQHQASMGPDRSIAPANERLVQILAPAPPSVSPPVLPPAKQDPEAS